MLTLSRLYIHPIKSMRGMQISHAQTLASGLAFDRIFMLTDVNGTFITARQYPEMVMFTPALLPDGLLLSAPDNSCASVRYADFSPEAAATEVWGNQFTALIAPDSVNAWLSQFFPHSVQLRWVGNNMSRRVKRFQQVPLGFADGFPFLLINEASLHDLRQRCPAGIRLEQFRPNLVVAGGRAWEEDSWSVVRVGNQLFDVAKPCNRCVLSTVSPDKGRRHPTGEPLSTLQTFRTASDKQTDVDFGLNLTARTTGIIRAGDDVEVISHHSPRRYGVGQSAESPGSHDQTSGELNISWQGETFRGNNQQVLLEQLELQGYRIPYSCRAGICGSCRIRLLSGQVHALKKVGQREDGTILSCCCIPAGELQLTSS
ncbi:YcbX family protein [Erwinia papayae]|uniref:YcbX family protein n=1 Tax=Erwinia papayae TaxID=206499 RepID=A0ABV3MW88_9GAMM